MAQSVILDSRGRPMQRAVLKQEMGGATIGGVRQPTGGYPGDGLNPLRLGALLKEADQGDPVRFLELAEAIEERDPHLIGVLGTRKRSVAQLEITVEDGGADAFSKKLGDLVRDWLKRDELTSELFDMLDAIHKGYSFTEIIWGDGKTWWPERLEWRDPRWFDFDRRDLRSPQLIEQGGQRVPLPGGKFIFAPMPAKSGIPTRGGLARVLAWAWMFKAFTNRDWAIFTQTYGQPIRVGKYGQGASDADKTTLFRAVANIAGDCAAIIPESMKIEFIEAGSVGASAGLYKERADFFDLQTSKAVLGQTATTDAVTGGLGSGKEHRQVQEDIERSDAKQLAAVINRDLIRVWIDLEYGPQESYPKVRIGRPEPKDVAGMVGAATSMALTVKKSEAYALAGFSVPDAGDEVISLRPASTPAPGPEVPQQAPAETGLQAQQPALPTRDELEQMSADIVSEAQDALFDQLGTVVTAASSLDDLQARLKAIAPGIDRTALRAAMRQALVIAQLVGRVDLLNGR